MLASGETQPVTLGDYWRLLLRRRWWILLPFFLVPTAAFVFSLTVPNLYRSETVIMVEQQRVPEHYVIPNVSGDLQDRLQTMTQQILSRTRLQRIIDQFNLYADKRRELPPEDIIDLMRSHIGMELVQSGTRNHLGAFKISFAAADPQLAQRVTGQLASLFIEENLRVREQRAENTTAFLEVQLEEARRHLQEEEERLRKYKVRHLGQLPEQQTANLQILNGLYLRLQGVNEALNQARQQQAYLESLLSQYEALAANQQTSPGTPPSGPRAVKDELVRLRAQRSALQARYTERHPEIIRLDEEIEQAHVLLEKMNGELRQSPEKAGEAGEKVSESPEAASSIAQVRSQLQANELEISNLQDGQRKVQAQIDSYQARLQGTPVREQELADIMRNHENIRQHYEGLLNKKLQSELATSLEKRQQGEQFRVLDPANLPVRPFSPNRRRIHFLGILGGLLLGAGLGVLAELRDESLHSENEILAVTGLPVWARIPQLCTTAENRKRYYRYTLEGLAATAMISAVAVQSVWIYWRGY